jgi:capsular exopolysaccharide synthesis family protein
MSKIFQAITRAEGEVADAVLSSVETNGVLAADDAAAREVLEALQGEEFRIAPAREPDAAPPGLHEGDRAPGSGPEIGPAYSIPPASEPATLRYSVPAPRTVQLKVSASSPLLPFDFEYGQAAEQYRIIRTKILQDPRKPRVLLISSGGSGDGKTVTAINIAGALALKAEGHVLLIDGDLRRSSMHSQLSLPLEPGLTDVLMDRCGLDDAILRAQQFPNLHLLTAGMSVPNPGDLLDSSRWLALVEMVRTRFRFVVIDSPPSACVADYDLLQAAADGVALVVRPDHTDYTGFLKAAQAVPRQKMLGVVVNCEPTWFLTKQPANYHYGYTRGSGK